MVHTPKLPEKVDYLPSLIVFEDNDKGAESFLSGNDYKAIDDCTRLDYQIMRRNVSLV